METAVKSPVKDAMTETSPCASPREKSARLEELEEAKEGEVIEESESEDEMETVSVFLVFIPGVLQT